MDILLVLVTLFVLFAWSRAMLRFRDRVITLKEFIFWSVIWGGAIVLAVKSTLQRPDRDQRAPYFFDALRR